MDAIDRYLERHELGSMIEGVIARYDGMDPRNLKPSPHLVELAMIGIGPHRGGPHSWAIRPPTSRQHERQVSTASGMPTSPANGRCWPTLEPTQS
jgi:hypothetical protein